MKTIRSITLFSLLFTAVAVQGQEMNQQSIWLTVNDQSLVPSNENGRLVSSSSILQSIIDDHSLLTFEQAVPASKNPSLLKVYEVVCDCNEGMLIEAFKSSGLAIENPEHGPDYLPLYTPDDYNITFANDYALDLINAESAWDITKGDTAIDIAISDTKYDLAHEELQNTVSFDQGGYSYPNHYHGTAVATIAAGNTNNTLGKSSIGSDCELQLYKIGFNEILMATYNGAKVINLSWSAGCGYSSYQEQIIQEAVDNGSIIVAAAGNGGTCGGASKLVYPASYYNVISVTSVGPQNNHERTIGDASTTHQHNSQVDIAAPGYDVALTVSSGWYLTGNGTSFAAPYVSGTIGLMLAINPCLTQFDVKNILQATAYNLDTINPAYAGLLGAGRLDAAAAVAMAQDYQTYEIEFMTSYSCEEQAMLVEAEEVGGNLTNYTTSWSHGPSEDTIYIDQSGFYTITMTDNNGCSGLAEIEIELPQPLTVIETIEQPNCFVETGSISIDIQGGYPAYNVLWSNGSTDLLVEDLDVGWYSLEVTDSMGCISETTYQINEMEQIQINVVDIKPANQHEDGLIDIEVIGGTAPLTYFWSDGSNTEDISASEGDYKVSIMDANGCTKENTYTIQTTAQMTNQDNTTITIYPNPSKDNNPTVSWTGAFQTLKVYNVHGQIIYTAPIEGLQKIQLFDLVSGVYFIQFDELRIESEKIIIL